MSDEDEQGEEGEEAPTYSDVDLTIRIVDDEGDPVEGVQVSVGDEHGTRWGDSETYTDGDGEVTFTVKAWKTYDLWVDHDPSGEVGVAGEGKTFEFTLGEDDDDDDD